MGEASERLEYIVDSKAYNIKNQLMSRGVKASNELRSASLQVLRGQRTGKRYKVPGTYKRQLDMVTGKMRKGVYYTASSPGEPPAAASSTLRRSFMPKTTLENGARGYIVKSSISSNVKYAKWLEDGTRRIAPRPYVDRIKDKAMPKIDSIYRRPYEH